MSVYNGIVAKSAMHMLAVAKMLPSINVASNFIAEPQNKEYAASDEAMVRSGTLYRPQISTHRQRRPTRALAM